MSLPTLYEHYTTGGVSAGLSADQPYFTLNNKNITLYSGALHYFRVPQEYWRDRLRKMRAAGLNTVETYVPWNLHEPEPGVYDFGNGGSDFQELLDIEKFLKIAQEEDLFTIVRPGPYICAEWEFGGLPSWLLREKGIEVRTSDKVFMGYVERYFKILLAMLTVFQFTNGGSIIAFQIENEYGSMKRKDLDYMGGLKNMFLDSGIKELLVTSDNPLLGNDGQVPGVLYTSNFKDVPELNLGIAQAFQPGKPSMVMEYWTGWYDHWADKHNIVTNERYSNILERILKFPSSVNMFMFHGGTSFGFTNGGNLYDIFSDNGGYSPDTTSYDYDAPLNEMGDYTIKYESTKRIIDQYNEVKTKLPEAPELKPRKAYGSIKIEEELNLEALINQAPHKIQSEEVIPMELLPINNNAGQSYGYIVYRKTNLDISANSVLKIEGRVCDTAMVLINGKLVSKVLKTKEDLKGFGYWKKKDGTLVLGDEDISNATLDVVVENWGRANFGFLNQYNQFKGLWQGNVTINSENINGWKITPLEFKKNWTRSLEHWENKQSRIGPALYKTNLEIVGEPVDTYIDMRNWKKGFIVVNGFVLARHLHLGPQQAAYLPAPFLKEGSNEILIFEQFLAPENLNFSDKQIYEEK